ncbi:MAG: hypothetical protein MI923_15305 [Phycisphaerales bacterium]|nr:hypothetical protein [Phycisphaerales bacterium]
MPHSITDKEPFLQQRGHHGVAIAVRSRKKIVKLAYDYELDFLRAVARRRNH